MPDPTLNDVLQEAYASASPDKIIIDTVSIYYAGLVDDHGDPAELYLFSGENSTTVREDGVPLLVARIEAAAARNPGALVTFLGIPFQLTLPAVNIEAVAAAQFTIDSVEREMHAVLEAAAKSSKQIEVTYRSYVKGLEDAGPQSLPPRKFIMQGASAGNASASGRLAFLSIGNIPYPFDTYRAETFRTLVYG